MRPRYVVPIVILLMVLGAAQSIKGCFDNDNESRKQSATPPASVTEPEPLPAAPVTTLEDEASQPPTEVNTPDEIPGQVPIEPALARRIKNFVEALYLIKPEDTTRTRRQRMSKLVRKNQLDGLHLTVKQSTDLTTRGSPNMDKVYGSVLNDDKRFLEVKLPVEVSFTAPDGKVVDQETALLVSRWQQKKGRWIFQGIGPGGEGG